MFENNIQLSNWNLKEHEPIEVNDPGFEYRVAMARRFVKQIGEAVEEIISSYRFEPFDRVFIENAYDRINEYAEAVLDGAVQSGLIKPNYFSAGCSNSDDFSHMIEFIFEGINLRVEIDHTFDNQEIKRNRLFFINVGNADFNEALDMIRVVAGKPKTYPLADQYPITISD